VSVLRSVAGRRASARKVPLSPTLRPRTIGSAIGGGRQIGPTARTSSMEPTPGARFFHVSIVTDAPYVIGKGCDSSGIIGQLSKLDLAVAANRQKVRRGWYSHPSHARF